MSTENSLSFTISEEEEARVTAAIEELTSILKPRLESLTKEQRSEIPKMGDGTEPFVEKVLDYAKSNEEFAPAYMDVAELEIDMNAVNQLKDIYRPLIQLVEQLDDSIMLAGSEAYVSALAYYNSVKIGSRMNVAGAKSIFDDLKQRFAKTTSRQTNGALNGAG